MFYELYVVVVLGGLETSVDERPIILRLADKAVLTPTIVTCVVQVVCETEFSRIERVKS